MQQDEITVSFFLKYAITSGDHVFVTAMVDETYTYQGIQRRMVLGVIFF